MTDLARYYSDTVGALGADEDRINFTQEAADRFDAVCDLAIDLIVGAQVESEDSPYIGPALPDKLDVPVMEDVQTLLTLALFRYPVLADYLESILKKAGE